MKKFKLILLGLIAIVAISSCRSAQQLLSAAIKKDPNIVKTVNTVTKIDTVVMYKDTTIVPKTSSTAATTIDPTKTNQYQQLFQDKQYEVDLWKAKVDSLTGLPIGKDSIRVINKGDTIFASKKVPVKILVNVPGKQVTVIQIKKDVFWWLGLVTLSCVGIFILIWGIKTFTNFTPLGLASKGVGLITGLFKKK
jgi:hypothetical protein